MDLSHISKVAVIGGGTMGSGIAAHLANLGFQVSLLSLSKEEAVSGLERVRQQSPGGFMTQQAFNSIQTGTIAQNPDWIKEADWICEAVVEQLGPKRAVYQQIEEIQPAACLVSTNTSGIPLRDLSTGRTQWFRERFVGTHFFNPPRYLKLLELIPSESVSTEFLHSVSDFLEEKVARRVVIARDTPGFIANRFGMYALLQAIHTAEHLHLSSEQVDLITGPFLGRPRTGTFRLADVIGLDVIADISANLREACYYDGSTSVHTLPASTQALLEKRWLGNKAGQGYFRKEAKEIFVYDFLTGAYRQWQNPEFGSIERLGELDLVTRLKEAITLKDEVGEFLREHLFPIFRYAEAVREEICYTTLDFDRVMQWGFGWQMGPFELAQRIEAPGLKSDQYYQIDLGQLTKTMDCSGFAKKIPHEPQYRALADFKVKTSLEALKIYELDDNVTGLVIATKNGVITPKLAEELSATLTPDLDRAYVLIGQGKNFSVGYDLKFFLAKIEEGDFDSIEAEITKLHRLGELMDQRKVVAALHGYSLGAGLELAMSCPLIIADAEANIGLPEAKVGLIPGGRGTVLCHMLASGSARETAEMFARLVSGAVSKSAPEAQSLGYLRPDDLVSFHPDRLLHEAMRLAKQVKLRPRPEWQQPVGPVTGMIDQALVGLQKSSEWSSYDGAIAEKVKNVFLHAKSYEEAIALERFDFMDLMHRSLTQARIRHMVEIGKPLRN